ncbi:MAG: HU family DNA-binding protein [Syntrophaceae bacterium]|nr:HU family DNA-binding protein [Syntrophaceae bacterium]
MTKAEFVAKVAEKANISKKQASHELELIFGAISEILVAGDDIAIPGFGKFSIATRKARTGLNPQTREKLEIPEAKVPRFSAAQALKDVVKATKKKKK